MIFNHDTCRVYLMLIGLFLIGVTGCLQDPQIHEDRIVKKAQKEEPLAPLGLDSPHSLEVDEGQLVRFQAIPYTKSGKALLSVMSMPEGASFDDQTGTFQWVPSMADGNSEGGRRSYSVKLLLRSDADRRTSLERVITIIVNDLPQPLEIRTSDLSLPWQEGGLVTAKLDIIGMFLTENDKCSLDVMKIPEGARITRSASDPRAYTLSWTPHRHLIQVTNSTLVGGIRSLSFPLEVEAHCVNGLKTKLQTELTIQDTREDADVFFSSPQVEGLNQILIPLQVFDPNGEQIPEIQLSASPPYGTMTLVDWGVQSGKRFEVDPSRNVGLMWSHIPAERHGEKLSTTVSVCVKNDEGALARCSLVPINATFVTELDRAPEIYRKDWPLDKTTFVKAKTELKVNLPLVDLSGSASKVVIEPASMASEVTWASNQLVMQFQQPGRKVFDVVATNKKGYSTRETFLVEVLPESWSPILVLGRSENDDEIIKLAGSFNSFQVRDPSIAELSERDLALRSTLVITTYVLSQPNIASVIDTAITRMGRGQIVITTPLLNQLSGRLDQEAKALGVVFGARFKDEWPSDSLSDFYLKANSSLTAPDSQIKLMGSLTSESASPARITQYNRAYCQEKIALKSKLDLTHTSTLVVACKGRGFLGSIMFAGVEWGDLLTDAVDVGIPKQWMKEAMTP